MTTQPTRTPPDAQALTDALRVLRLAGATLAAAVAPAFARWPSTP